MRGRAGIPDHDDDPTLDPAINAACRAIDLHVGFAFYDSGAASALPPFEPDDEYCLTVPPFSTTTGLVIKTDADSDGVFETTWVAADYELVRFGGNYSYMFGTSATTMPYRQIRAVNANVFPTGLRRAQTVEVTARWGWTTVPDPVKEAAKMLAADIWDRRNVKQGVVSGTVEFGGVRVSNDMFTRLRSLLGPYRSASAMVG